ncbi:MAG: hypothetical protein DRJ52_05135 [Thermoprotei archaeon]|nr:MAG: hypothetical protein DRJ52_05135 [Thermoprotei archaeon]
MLNVKRKIIVLLLLVMLILYPLIIEPNFIIVITIVEVRLKNLPKNFNEFKIVHLSDIHFGEFHLKVRNDLVLNKVREVKPDLIVLTGDIVSNKRSIEDALDFVRKLASIARVIIVLGNWDHSSVAADVLLARLNLIENVTVLVNSHIIFSRNGEVVYLIGVDDPYTYRSNLTKALKNVPRDSVKILLAHSPQIINEAAGKVDLVLTGHTHGGQVVVPFIGPLFVPLPARFRRYTHGLFLVNGTYMYVSRGIGTSVLPIRFFAPPEITVIILKKNGS